MGKLIKAGATYYGQTSILVAEARAFKDGVNVAIHEEFDKVFIEGDNEIVIQALKSTINIPWQIANIIKDVQIRLNQGTQVQSIIVFKQQIGYQSADTPLLVHSPLMYVFYPFFEHYLLMM